MSSEAFYLGELPPVVPPKLADVELAASEEAAWLLAIKD